MVRVPLRFRCCGQRQPGNLFKTYMKMIMIFDDRMDEDFNSVPLGWIMIYGDHLNRDDTEKDRYGIVQYWNTGQYNDPKRVIRACLREDAHVRTLLRGV
jgi:hypothetical protein